MISFLNRLKSWAIALIVVCFLTGVSVSFSSCSSSGGSESTESTEGEEHPEEATDSEHPDSDEDEEHPEEDEDEE